MHLSESNKTTPRAYNTVHSASPSTCMYCAAFRTYTQARHIPSAHAKGLFESMFAQDLDPSPSIRSYHARLPSGETRSGVQQPRVVAVGRPRIRACLLSVLGLTGRRAFMVLFLDHYPKRFRVRNVIPFFFCCLLSFCFFPLPLFFFALELRKWYSCLIWQQHGRAGDCCGCPSAAGLVSPFPD
ncbi:hypothetical protein VTI28DRAFT_4689 [Corynascus sepedonium]